MLLFAIGATLGLLRPDPTWRADAVLGSMESVRFNIQGFRRSYWGFFVGFGLFVTVFVLFGAVLAWQLGGLAVEALARVCVLAWAFALCFAAVTVLTWRYFFAI